MPNIRLYSGSLLWSVQLTALCAYVVGEHKIFSDINYQSIYENIYAQSFKMHFKKQKRGTKIPLYLFYYKFIKPEFIICHFTLLDDVCSVNKIYYC